jgi:putative ABC transport system permease protein
MEVVLLIPRLSRRVSGPPLPQDRCAPSAEDDRKPPRLLRLQIRLIQAIERTKDEKMSHRRIQVYQGSVVQCCCSKDWEAQMEIPLDTFLGDVRYALRGMRRSPGFTTVAVMTLAVAIGINAGVFAVAGTVLFGGYPRVDPDNRIFYIGQLTTNAEFQDWEAQVKSFGGMAAVQDGGLRLVLQDDSGNSETCDTTQLSTNAFQVLGQKPIIGRDFAPSDGVPGAASVALLNYAYWERRFGKDPSVIGKSFRLGSVFGSFGEVAVKLVTVIGVMPPGFTFPTPRVDLWIQTVPEPDRQTFLWFVFGRLGKGVTRKTAQAEMDTIAHRLKSSYPLTNNSLPRLQSFGEQFWGTKAMAFYRAIWWAVGFVLLIGCANLANLLLARAIGRYREISLRIALGAGRWRVTRQLLIESLMLSSIAAVLGWFIALVSVRIYERIESPPGLYQQYQYVLDYRVLLYLIAISIFAGILFGLAPAVRLSKLNVNSTLKYGGRGATGGMSGKCLSALLVTAEIAVTIVLLAGAGLMTRSFLKIYTEDIGAKNTPNILVASVQLPATRYPDGQSGTVFFDRLTTKLKSIAGLDSVALANSLPGLNTFPVPYELAGSPAVDEQHRPTSFALTITPDYFRTVGAAVISGRDFNDFDRTAAPPVALVSELFARAHWHGVNPLGQRLRLYDGPNADAWRTVVGIASNIVQQDWAGNESGQVVYVPYRQRPPAAFMNILALTRVPPGNLAVPVRREIQAIDSGLDIGAGAGAGSIEGPVPLSERFRTVRYWSRAVNAGLLLTFAVIALLLAAIGLYAVIAHSVSRATQEIGIRIAIGATSRDIRLLVLRQGMLPVVTGLVIGLAASVGFNRLLQSQLFSVSSTDPTTYALTSVVLIAVALFACLIPAQRAMRVDPAVALRHE